MFNKHFILAIVAFLSGTRALVLQPRDCSFTWPAISGDTCQSLSESWSITEAQFISFNPGVKCPDLVVDTEYCVEWAGTPPVLPSSSKPSPSPTPSPSRTTTPSSSVKPSTTPKTSSGPAPPSPTQDGLVKDCQRFHLAVSGDTCSKLVSKYGTFSLTQFYAWNPAVGNDCSSLWLDYYYCIAVKGTPTTPPKTTTTPAKTSSAPAKTTAPTAPSPTQDGIAKTCKKYHKVASGDTCQKIVDKYKNFTLAQFYKWNPAVGSSCASLWLDYYVCISA